VEENNFGIRKRLLEYDDVMNSQREVIYTKRRHALFGERIQVDLSNMMFDTCEGMIAEHQSNVDFEGFKLDLIRTFSVDAPFTKDEFMKGKADELTETLHQKVWTSYQRKMEVIARQAYPVVKDVYENKGKLYENIVVPISDGQRVFQITTNLKKTYDSMGTELAKSFSKAMLLITIDEAWKEHLRELDDLKQSVQNASYEQKDPLLIYKFESFNLFKAMMERNNRSVVSLLAKAHIPIRDGSQVKEAEQRRQRQDLSGLKMQKDELPTSGIPGMNQNTPKKPERVQPVRVEKKVGRNDLCPCGSGKKYKHCHGKDA
jgi:preprotein translocase subunit SecA